MTATGDLGTVIFIISAAFVLLGMLWLAPALLERRSRRMIAARAAEDLAESEGGGLHLGSAASVSVPRPSLLDRAGYYMAEFLIVLVIIGLIILLLWFFSIYQSGGNVGPDGFVSG